MADGNLVRTTVRLPKTVHVALKTLALRSGNTLEQVIERALKRELARADAGTGSDSLAVDLYESVRSVLETFRTRHREVSVESIDPLRPEPFNWSPAMAHRFLEAVPALAVIKDRDARILWCNSAYATALKTPLSEMKGKTITELGFVDAKNRRMIETDIKRVIDTHSEMESIETVNIPGQTEGSGNEPRLMRVLRFVFKRGQEDTDFYLGDISFDFHKISATGSPAPEPEALLSKHAHGLFDLFQPFMLACPTAAAIKNRDRRLVWCNRVFLHLAGASSIDEIKGKTGEEIFGLDASDQLVFHETNVIDSNIWMSAEEQLPDWGPRTTIRFPVLSSNGQIQLIGALSANFQLSYEFKYMKIFPSKEPEPKP